MLESLIVAGLQFLEPVPELAEPGRVVEVRALDGSGRPIAGLPIEIALPDGSEESLGATDVRGLVTFEASMVGEHLIRAALPTPGGSPVLLWTPYQVVAGQRRWLYALACVPLGLVLLWANLKRLRSRTRPASAVRGP